MESYQWMENSIKALEAMAPPKDICQMTVCLTKSEWASWVQAGGSIVAILIAIVVAWYQNYSVLKRDKELARRERYRKCVIIFDVCDHLSLVLDRNFYAVIADMEKLKENFDELKSASDHLASINHHDCPDAEDIREFTVVKKGFDFAFCKVEESLKTGVAIDARSGDFLGINDFRKYIVYLKDEMWKKIESCGTADEIAKMKEITSARQSQKIKLGTP